MLGVDQSTVAGHVEHAPFAGDEFHLDVFQGCLQLSGQTGSLGSVVSFGAVLDLDAHGQELGSKGVGFGGYTVSACGAKPKG